MNDAASDETATPPTDHDDPRLQEPNGEQGMPGEVIDSPRNMPGDQPIGEERPNKTDLERDPDA